MERDMEQSIILKGNAVTVNAGDQAKRVINSKTNLFKSSQKIVLIQVTNLRERLIKNKKSKNYHLKEGSFNIKTTQSHIKM